MEKFNICCPHFSVCSGCVFDKNVDKPEILIEVRAFFKLVGIDNLILHCGAPTGWRTRAKLAVRGTLQKPVIGLFEKGSHRVVAIPHCRVHHAAINLAIEEVKTWMMHHGVVPYDESSLTGLLRYLQLAVDRTTSRVQLVLVVNEKRSTRIHELVELLWKQKPELWHSIWINENMRKDNIIFGPEWHLQQGERWLVETLRGKPICFHPASFVQANLKMFEKLLDHVSVTMDPDKDAIDFYAGSGAIGIAVSDRCHSLSCVEINPIGKECFEESLKRLDPRVAQRLTFVSASSEKSLDMLKDKSAQIVIVDPPRKGLGKVVVEALNTSKNIQKLVYVSCGWAGFQRDCQQLLMGGWRLSQAEAFLFFPGSNHLEILAIFER